LTATAGSGAAPPTAATVFLPGGSPYMGAGSATAGAAAYSGYYSGPVPQSATTHAALLPTGTQSTGSPPGPPGAAGHRDGAAPRPTGGPGGGVGLGMNSDAPALGSGPGGARMVAASS
jgi:translation initiation factor IF-2